MAWIDDRIWCHPKFADISSDAAWAYVKGVAYSAGFSTAGHLTPGQLKTLGIGPKDSRALLACGLWETNGNGIVIHDWDEHNGKRDARRAADRDRKRTARSEGQSA